MSSGDRVSGMCSRCGGWVDNLVNSMCYMCELYLNYKSRNLIKFGKCVKCDKETELYDTMCRDCRLYVDYKLVICRRKISSDEFIEEGGYSE